MSPDVSWIVIGNLRRRVIKSLEKPKTATVLVKELDSHRSTVSEVLNLMAKKDLAECQNSDEPYNRYYSLTKKGIKLAEKLQKYS